MDSAFYVQMCTITLWIVTIVVFFVFWGFVIKILQKIDKYLDLKIIETEIKIDRDKF